MALLDKVIKKLMRDNKKEDLAVMLADSEKQREALAETVADLKIKLQNSMVVFPSDGVVIRTDGTIGGSDIFIDGERPHQITSVRLWMNIQNGIELSYETLEDGDFERVWVYGEDSERSAEYQKEKEKRRERVNKEIKRNAEEADERKVVDWKGKEIPKDDIEDERDSVTLEDRWICSHCMAGNTKSTARQKKDKIQCLVCKQWSKK
jgi:formylmethanofuran dehydrogenase subunit E